MSAKPQGLSRSLVPHAASVRPVVPTAVSWVALRAARHRPSSNHSIDRCVALQQAGPRGNRELEFYESVRRAVLADLATGKPSVPVTPGAALERHRSRLAASASTADDVSQTGAAPDAAAVADASPARVPVSMDSVDAPTGGLAVIGSDDGGFSASPMARTSGDGLDFAGAFGRPGPAGAAAGRSTGDALHRTGMSPGSSAGSDIGSDSGRGEGSAHSGVSCSHSSNGCNHVIDLRAL